MAEITAKRVNELRAKTGLGMMECKKVLTEVGGDIEMAIEALRKKGLKDTIRDRAATEGRVAVAISPDGKTAVAVEVVCNTDFTAKSETVERIANTAAQKLLANPTSTPQEDFELKAELTAVAQKTGENVQLGRTAVVSNPDGLAGAYLYSTAGKGKIAVLVALDGQGSEELVRNLGMHIAAARPVAMTRAEVSPELVAKEREIAVEQAKSSGKPQNIAEKIAEGKMNAFYGERVLLDQEFINAEVFKGTVANMLKGKGATLQKYVRLEVGQ